jgi:hypothetical protein
MKKLHIAFYKASNGKWDDKLIDKFSGNLGYSHCEIVINANTMIGAHYEAGGVKKFRYNDVYNSSLWDVYELDLPAKKAKQFVHDMLDTPYDTKGVVLHFLGLHYGDREDMVWCSELCSLAVNIANEHMFIDTLIMPNDMIPILKENGAKLLTKKLASSRETRPVIDRFGRVE